MAITSEDGTTWTPLTVKVTPEMNDAIERFMEETGQESRSAAIRMLIGAGLDMNLGTQTELLDAMRAEAVGQVLHRLGELMGSVVEIVRDGEFFPDAQEVKDGR